MGGYYSKHYILTGVDNNIIDGWSDGPFPNRGASGAICINEHGGYQFRLFPGGEENPMLRNDDGIYLYRYINGGITAKTPKEIETELAVLPKPAQAPTIEDRQAALERAVLEMAGEIYG